MGSKEIKDMVVDPGPGPPNVESENGVVQVVAEVELSDQTIAFRRSTLSARSPPPAAISAAPDKEGEGSVPAKRIRSPSGQVLELKKARLFGLSSSSGDLSKCVGSTLDQLVIKVTAIRDEIKSLNRLIMETATTKKEIKWSAAKLTGLAVILDHLVADRVEAERTKSSSVAVKPMVSHMSCQTIDPRLVREEEVASQIRRSIMDVSEQGVLRDVLAKQWPRATYVRSEVAMRGFKESHGAKILLLDWKNIDEANGAIKAFTNIGQIEKEAIPTGEFATLEQSSTFSLTGKVGSTQSDCLTIGGIDDEDEFGVLNLMCRMAEILKQKGHSQLSMKLPVRFNLDMCLKLCEITATKVDVKIFICAKKTHKKPDWAGKSSGVVLIPPSNKEWSEVVKGLKSSINPEDLGISVINLSRTNDGATRIQYKERERGAASKLLSSIKDKVSCDAKNITKSKGFVIYNVDTDLSTDDIREALMDEFRLSPDEILNIGEYRRDKNGVPICFVYLNASISQKISGFLRLGWKRSKIFEKIAVDFCQNCQTYGHSRRECRSSVAVDRLCHNCGGKDHLSRDCKAEAFCFSCNVSGHRANSTSCPRFKELLLAKKSKR